MCLQSVVYVRTYCFYCCFCYPTEARTTNAKTKVKRFVVWGGGGMFVPFLLCAGIPSEKEIVFCVAART